MSKLTFLPSLHHKRFKLPDDIQIIPMELYLKTSKWLIVSVYRPPKQNLKYFISILSNLLAFYNYSKCVVIGEFNLERKQHSVFLYGSSNVAQLYLLKHVGKLKKAAALTLFFQVKSTASNIQAL